MGNNLIIKDEKYNLLVEQIKCAVTEGIHNSRWILVETYWNIGQLIREDFSQKGITELLQDLAVDTGISQRTLWYAVQFCDKYPSLDKVPEGKNISWNKVITKYLPAPKEKNIELPKGKYNVIYADPPWKFDNSGLEESAESHYKTMPTDDICNMALKDLCSPNTVLFMWATNAMLEDALRVVNAWGFDYKSNFVWIKNKGPQMGWFVISRHELLLICTGKANPHPKTKPVSWFKAEATKHSKKPEIVYEMIEKMYSGPYIELFARNKRNGWESFGSEIPED